jgi:hypothetical protein
MLFRRPRNVSQADTPQIRDFSTKKSRRIIGHTDAEHVSEYLPEVDSDFLLLTSGGTPPKP